MENLFGFEDINRRGLKVKSKDYKTFVEKFKPKKTTDDCYTPDYIYNTILKWVADNSNIEGMTIVRPFYPEGDYVNYSYPENCIVIDNPPFSIITPIVRFFNEKGIKYFLFAPHLTLFQSPAKNYIISSSIITYENGAKVNTSFVSNLFGDLKIWGCSELYNLIKKSIGENSNTLKLPKYEYPNEIVTVSRISKIVNKGVSIKIREGVQYVSALDSQKKVGKTVFGGAFLISKRTMACVQQAENEAKNKAENEAKNKAENEAKNKAENENKTIWGISEREQKIVNNL